MAEHSDDSNTSGWRRWAQLAVGCAVVAVAGYGVVPSATGGAGAAGELPIEAVPTTESSDDISVVYGLTPADLAAVADRLDDRKSDRYVVAGYAGEESPPGMMLTRSKRTDHLVDDAANLEVRSAGGSWFRVERRESDATRRAVSLATADVAVVDGESRRRCPRLGLRQFQCERAGWSQIEWRRLEIGGSKSRCIWAHPIEDRRIGVDFGSVPPARDGSYQLHTALADRAAGGGSAVDVSLRIGDRSLDVSHQPDKGWRRTDLPTLDAPGRLELEISADDVGQRHFCFRVRPS